MEDKLIEVWKKEYFDLTGDISGYGAKWSGFLLAKRSQPVVELPDSLVLTLALGDTVPLLIKSEVIEVLQSASIPFKVRGE